MMNDLFGHVPQRSASADEAVAVACVEHTPDTIRVLMHEILAEARAAKALPWTPRKLRSHTARFPYMAEWLSGDEGGRLMREFKAELDRLQAPLAEVAPNWRRIWDADAKPS